MPSSCLPAPLFPFGYGLSYTGFTLAHLRVDAYRAQVDVANTGARDGAVTIQIYVAKPGPDGFVKRLAGFLKTTLAAGGHATVDIGLEPRIFARCGADAVWQDIVL